MALTTVSNLATGDVITEAWVDSVTLNLNSHKTYAEGATPFPGTVQKFGNDANFQLAISGGAPLIVLDSNDFLTWDRSGNHLDLYIGGAAKFVIDSNGLIQTAAFRSSEQTVTAGSTLTLAHGLGVRPGFVCAVYGTATGTANATRQVVPSFNSLGAFVRQSQADATNLVFINETAVTIYLYAFALK